MRSRRGALILATCFPRRIPDSVTPFMLYYAKGLGRIFTHVEVVVPHSEEMDRAREKDCERHENIEIHRFTYFFRNSWQRLCYLNGIPNNLRTYPVAWLQVPFFLGAALLRAVRSRRDIDVVYCHWTPTVIAGVMMRLLGKKVVAVLHGSDARLLSPALNRFFLNRTHAVVTGHEEIFEYVTNVIRPRTPVRLVRNFIDEESFSWSENPLNKKILFVGRLDPHKQPMQFLETAKRLLHKRSALEFSIIGDGILRPQVEQFIEREKLENVRFLGPREDVPSLLAGHSACIFWGKVENIWSTTIIEAIQANRLCLLSMAGKTGEVFTDLENALLFDSIDGAVEKLELIEEGKIDARKISDNARHLISKYGFGTESILNGHREVLDQCYR